MRLTLCNGVQTIISVSEEGMELCKKSMTTLLQSYVIDRAPSEWRGAPGESEHAPE
jgi:hypothetical protein